MPPIDPMLTLTAIRGMTVPFRDLHYLRPERLLDFAAITTCTVTSVTPLSILYACAGVLQCIPLRGIPVDMKGRVVYPVSSQMLPALRGRLTMNAAEHTLRFQGNLCWPAGERVKGITLAVIALAFSLAPANAGPGRPSRVVGVMQEGATESGE